MPAIHLIIKGKVQGVFYRATAKKIAGENGITGWVQNTPDENVEIMASGTQLDLQRFIAWCRKGPACAKVTDVVIAESIEEGFNEFVIKR